MQRGSEDLDVSLSRGEGLRDFMADGEFKPDLFAGLHRSPPGPLLLWAVSSLYQCLHTHRPSVQGLLSPSG